MCRPTDEMIGGDLEIFKRFRKCREWSADYESSITGTSGQNPTENNPEKKKRKKQG